jgi:cell division transport system permease protein
VVNAESLYIFRLLSFNPLIYKVSVVMLLIGALIGMWGSVISMRRFLRV